MKRLLLPLMAISIALTSCSRDNDDITNPIETPVAQAKKLTGVTETSTSKYNIDHSLYLTYNNDKLISSRFEDGLQQLDYIYENDKIVGINNGRLSARLTYNPDGTLKSSISNEVNREYTYDGNLVKVKEISKYTNSSQTIEYIFTMENGNMVKQEIYFTDGFGSNQKITLNFKYDNNKNPIQEIKGISNLAIELELQERATHIPYHYKAFKNNLISEEIWLDGGYSIDQVNYTYEYDKDGYPIKSILKSEHRGNTELIYNYQ